MTNKRISIIGAHGVGKTTICEKVMEYISCSANEYGEAMFSKKFIDNIAFVNETFRQVLNSANLSSEDQKKQSESMTLATYAKQFYLEHFYNLQGKNIISDRSAFDCFIYNDYYSKALDKYSSHYLYAKAQALFHTKHFYDIVYLIEPSDRPIEDDNFRLTDKKSQQDVHNLFLKHLKEFKNVVIVNQEEQDNIVDDIINFLV